MQDALIQDAYKPNVSVETQEDLTIDLDQVSGVDPVLPGFITKQADVPATAFKNPWTLLSYLPKKLRHSVTINIKSDIKARTHAGTVGDPVFNFENFNQDGYDPSLPSANQFMQIYLIGEKLYAYQAQAITSITDSWRVNFAANSFIASELVGKHFTVVSGTGAGQEHIIRDNGTDWIEVLNKQSPALNATSVLDIWSPKWSIDGSTDGVTPWAGALIYGYRCGISLKASYLNFVRPKWYFAFSPYSANTLLSFYYDVFDGGLNASMSYGILDSGTGLGPSTVFCWGCRVKRMRREFMYMQKGLGQFWRGWLDDSHGFVARSTPSEIQINDILMSNTPPASIYGPINARTGGKLFVYGNSSSGVRLTDNTPGTKVMGHPSGRHGIQLHGFGAALQLEGRVEIHDTGSPGAALYFTLGSCWNFGPGYTASTILGANNNYGIRVEQGNMAIPISRACRPQVATPGSVNELMVDNRGYTYAQLEAIGYIKHEATGTIVYDEGFSPTPKSAGLALKGIVAFAAESSKTVVLPVSLADASYVVHLTPDDNVVLWCPTGTRTSSQFVIQASASWTGNVAWRVEKI